MNETQIAGPGDLSQIPVSQRSVRLLPTVTYHGLLREMDVDQARFLVDYCRARAHGSDVAVLPGEIGADTRTRWQYLAYTAYWCSLAEALERRQDGRR
jgi:hypothetical protein